MAGPRVQPSSTATLEIVAHGAQFEPVEVDLSLSEWFIEAVAEER